MRPAQEPLSEPTWALCTSTWALQTDLWSQETSKRLPGSILERFRTPLPKLPPRGAQERPGTPRRPPPSAPRAPPGKHGFRAALAAKLGPTGTEKPSKGPSQAIFDPPHAGFASSGGRLSYSFLLSDSIAKAVLWAKLAQAYAQHRFTSLCNFYR